MPDRIIIGELGTVVELPPEPASPLDLADTIVKLRGESSFPEFVPSDSGMRKLLELAFYISITADEGRYPRLHIVCEKPTDNRLAVKFSTPVVFHAHRQTRRVC